MSAFRACFSWLWGLSFLLAPGNQTERFALFPSSNAGYNTLRGDFGGLFFGMALFCCVGAVRASARWLLVPASFLGFIILGRLTSLIFDGPSPEAIRMMAIEIVILLILLAAARSFREIRLFGFVPLLAAAVILFILLGGAYAFERPLG